MNLENIKINCTFDENLLRFSNEVITGQISISIGTFKFPSLYWIFRLYAIYLLPNHFLMNNFTLPITAPFIVIVGGFQTSA